MPRPSSGERCKLRDLPWFGPETQQSSQKAGSWTSHLFRELEAISGREAAGTEPRFLQVGGMLKAR